MVMAELTKDSLSVFNVGPIWRRLLLLLPAALALYGAWHAIRWCMGSTIAEHAPDFEIARTAERLAPADPQSHFTLAVMTKNNIAPDALARSIPHYERAVSLSPNDYRLWIELGRAREQSGDSTGGEQALRRAVELAPSYAYPRWTLGNLLLRRNRPAEAFEQLQQAAEADPTLRPQVFSLAWRAYGGSVEQTIAAVGRTPGARAQLAQFLINNKRLDAALDLWNTIEPGDKRAQAEAGQALIRALFAEKQFHHVLDVHRAIADDVKAGQVGNGDFEYDIGPPGGDLFGWQVVSDPRAQVRIDAATFFRGKRSLRVAFNAATALEFQNVSQLIVVEPRTRYRLDYFVRTDELKSASTLRVEALDAGDPKQPLAASDPAPNGSTGWQQSTLEFTTGPRTEAVTLRISRDACITGACPIFGKIWYDDFNLQRVGGGAPAAGARQAAATVGRGSENADAR